MISFWGILGLRKLRPGGSQILHRAGHEISLISRSTWKTQPGTFDNLAEKELSDYLILRL